MKMTDEELQIYREFEFFGANAKKWMNKCILMLPKIEKMRIWEKRGFKDIYEFARKLAGMSRNKVNEGLRVLRRTDGLSAIRAVIEDKGLWAIKPIVRMVNKENEKFWADKAREMNRHTLITYVRDMEMQAKSEQLKFGDSVIESGRAGAGNPLENGLDKPNVSQENPAEDLGKEPVPKITVSMKLDSRLVHELNKLKGTDNWNTLLKTLLESHQREQAKYERELESELEAEKPQKIENASRHVPAKIAKFIKKRAGDKCEFPGCSKPGKHLHHTDPFSLKKEHDPDKIRLLCKEHHNIAHHGLIENEDHNSESWLVREFPDLTDLRTLINDRIADHKQYKTNEKN